MPATATKQRSKSPKVVIGEDKSRDNLIGFIPEALWIYPKTLDVSVGTARHGRASVHIEEDDYEHNFFYFNLTVEGPNNGVFGCFSEVSLDGAGLTLVGLDNLIEALIVARAEASKLGLSTQRSAPKVKPA